MVKRKTLTKIMAIFAVALSLVFPIGGLAGCSEEVEPVTPYAIKNFVNFVTRIETPITIDSGADIEAGYIIYDHLNDAYKTDGEVQAKKSDLDGYKAEYDVLKAEQDRLDAEALQASYRAKFERAVNKLPVASGLKLGDKNDIEAAYALYENLDEASRAELSVVTAYGKLGLLSQKMEELEYEAWLEEITAKAEEFVEGVELLTEDEITLDSSYALSDLKYLYEKLDNEAKAFENVVAAKEKLDVAAAEYQVLKDENDVEEFLDKVKKLPAADKITLNNAKDITNAESQYVKMSDAAKAADGVAEAYEKLCAAREKYDVLFVAEEKIKIEEFIKAANAIPEDVSGVDISWFDILEDAGNKYWDLLDFSPSSQSLPEVEAAFDRWDAAQSVFDRLGFKQIPMNNPSGNGQGGIVLSGDNNLVFQLEDKLFDPLREFFGVGSIAALDEKAVLELNIYKDGVFVDKTEVLFAALINNGHILPSGVILNALKALSEENAEIVSGASYSFSLSIRDKNGEFIPSKESAISPSTRGYIW